MCDVRTDQTIHFDALLEAAHGRAFDVVIITAGKSHNAVEGKALFYSEGLLTRSASLFEGAMVNAQRFGEQFDHIWDDDVEKSDFAGNTVGVLEGVHFADGALRARLLLHEGADFMAGLLKLSTERDTPLVGLSIDAKGSVEFTAIEGVGDVANVTELAPGPSVDIVSRPAAGGEIIRLAASLHKEINTMPQEPKPQDAAEKKEPEVVKPFDTEAFRESVAKEATEAALAEFRKEQAEKDKAAEVIREAVKARVKLVEGKLSECNLSTAAQGLIRATFDFNQDITEEQIDSAIGDQRAVLAESDSSGAVSVPMKLGLEPRDKAGTALYDMFMQTSVESSRLAARKTLKEAGLQPIHSIHRWTQEAFGIDLRDGAFGDTKQRLKLTESLTTGSWTDVFGDTMNRALLDAYRDNPWTDWRRIVSVRPLADFRTQHSIRMGGYGNLPTVSEGANYLAQTSPGDEEHEWTPTKRGGTEDLTREMMLADDIGSIARIPTSLAYAASRTLYEFVFDLIDIAGQPTMDYDGVALYATSRSTNDNLGTTALAAAEVIVVWRAMQKFTELTSAKRAAIRPKFLCVPVDLANTAFDIVKPLGSFPGGETDDLAFQRTIGLEVIVVAHWTNAKDHFYIADPALVPGFLMGFIGGREEPELQIQDMQNVGSVFSRDAITYKIRHEYGGSPVDHRAFYGENVA